MTTSPLGLLAPPAGELDVTGDLLTPEEARQASFAISRFLAYCQVKLIPGCPLSRWLQGLAEVQAEWRSWRDAFASGPMQNQRKAYDLVEARRIAARHHRLASLHLCCR